MAALLDLTGERFGALTVLERGPSKVSSGGFRRTTWVCRCDCGNVAVVAALKLRSGKTRSCGCLTNSLRAAHHTTHGMSHTLIFNVWMRMLARCEKPYDTSYKHYGGRGIKVCDRWKSFENFWADMGPGYQQGLLLERIDNDGNYEPENCRWATRIEQARNKRNTVWVELEPFGKIRLTELAELTGVSYKLLHGRLRHGRPLLRPEEAARCINTN